MSRRRSPRAALEHIEEAIALIEGYLRQRKRPDLDRDPMLRQAIERNFEIISEASRHLLDAWKADHPEVPWRKVAGIGNVLRHDYDRVDNTVLWRAATAEVQAPERGRRGHPTRDRGQGEPIGLPGEMA